MEAKKNGETEEDTVRGIKLTIEEGDSRKRTQLITLFFYLSPPSTMFILNILISFVECCMVC